MFGATSLAAGISAATAQICATGASISGAIANGWACNKQRAEVQVLTARQNAQAAIAEAEGAKQSAILQAQSEAEARHLRGEAEASAIAAKGKEAQIP